MGGRLVIRNQDPDGVRFEKRVSLKDRARLELLDMVKPNTVLEGRYLIVREVGRGSQGTVYQAEDTELRRTVAIKENCSRDDHALRLVLEREATLLAKLKRHETLPVVFDYFAQKDCQYLIMEFFPGEHLGDMVKARGSPFPARQVLDWADQLLDALILLQTMDPPIIHKDIKPQNLKLTPQNRIVLLDFGLARELTMESLVRGYTPMYASPELRAGGAIDRRSDLYSLGATLYYLLSGVRAPDAASRLLAVSSGLADPIVPVSEINTQVPSGIARILSRAMALDPDARPADAREMREMLRSEFPNAAMRGTRFTVQLSPEREERTGRETKKYGVLGFCEGQVLSVALSPDGRLAASSSGEKKTRIWDLVTGDVSVLGATARAAPFVEFSPDGRTVLSGGGGFRLWKFDGALVVERGGADYLCATFSVDGKFIVLGHADRATDRGILSLFDVSKDEIRALGAAPSWIRSIAVSPDGETVATASWDIHQTICIWNLRTGVSRTLGGCADYVNSIAFSPDGRMLVSGGRRLRIWRLRDRATKIFESDSGRISAVAFSPDGKAIAAVGNIVRLWDPSTGAARILTKCEAALNTIAVTRHDPIVLAGGADGCLRLWRMDSSPGGKVTF